MRVRDSEDALSMISPINNDVLGASKALSITNDNSSYLIHSGLRKVVTPSITVLIKVKRDPALLIRSHNGGQLKGLLIKMDSRVNLMKNALK